MKMVRSSVEGYTVFFTLKMERPFANPIGNPSNDTSKVWIAMSLISCIKIMEIKVKISDKPYKTLSCIQEDSISLVDSCVIFLIPLKIPLVFSLPNLSTMLPTTESLMALHI
jgi:hypothetical protein